MKSQIEKLTKKQVEVLHCMLNAYKEHKTLNRLCISHADSRYIPDKLVKLGLAKREWQWMDSDCIMWDTKEDAIASEEYINDDFPYYYACYTINKNGMEYLKHHEITN